VVGKISLPSIPLGVYSVYSSNEGNVIVKRTLNPTASLLLGAVAVAAIVTAPVASAADQQSCVSTGGSTDCQAPSSAQIYASPHSLPAVSSHSDPRWRALGYNPKWNGFEQ
jgi:hypothetical protein